MNYQKHLQRYLYRISSAVLCLMLAASFVHIKAQNITRPTVRVPNGFEVNSYTGNLFYKRTDLNMPGRGFPVDISFSYNSSKLSKNFGYGKGWTFTYNMLYVTDPLGMYIERSDGRKDFFTKTGSSFTPPKGVFDTLKEYQPNKFYLRDKSGTKYFFDNSTHKKLTRMEDRNGNAVTLSYTDTLLTTLTDASNRTCTFNWQNGYLAEIIDNSATPARRLSYSYNPAGQLIRATDPLNHFVVYHYDAGGKIIGMTDKRGYNMSVVYYKTNAVAKFISCVTTHEFSYVQASLTTHVTETVSDNKQITSYQYDDKGNVIRKQGNCCGYNLSYQYDGNNNISNLKNGINQETKYEYDSKGNLIKETDALGNSITYTYEPVFNQVTSIKDKRGNTITNEYDAKGNLTKTTKPLGIVENFTYASNGDLLSYKDGNENTTAYEYNTNGDLSKITDGENGITIYGYDNSGNRTSEIDTRGSTTGYQYNALNSLTRITDPLNHATVYTYDAADNRISETNARGKRTNYEYDGINRQIRTVTPLGIATGTKYDEKGNIIQTIDGRGNANRAVYNNRNQVLTSTDGLGNTESFEYDDAGNRTGITDKNGNKTKYEYDAVSRLVKTTNALGGPMAYSYDANGNRVTTTDANGNTMAFEYDAVNRPVKMTDALNKSVVYEYDKNNNRIGETDKNGNKTTYQYDKLNRLKKRTDALNGVETYAYDGNGNLLTRTDALNHITTTVFDALDRPLSVTNAVSDITTYTYDSVGNMIKTAMPNGNIVLNTYDSDNRQTSETDSIGMVVQYSYDNGGNIITQTDGVNNTTSYQYDAANRLVRTTFANNTSHQFAYDKNGNKLQDIDQKGYATLYEYDVLNRLVKTTDALGFASRFAFDANGNTTNTIDAKGNTTSYNYDPLNRLTKQIFPNGSSTAFTYDAFGHPLTRKDNKGIITQFKYDKLNRIIERSYPANIVDSFKYDAIGRLREAINNNATVTFTYDAVSRLLSENMNGKQVVYTHNTIARTKTITYPSGMQITKEMDKRSRLATINEGGSMLASFHYDGSDRLITKQYRNNTNTDYTYDNVNNLTDIAVSPNNLLKITYTYDSLNNPTLANRLYRESFSEQYGYDNLSQVKNLKRGKYQGGSVTPAFQQLFIYDGLGNRVITTDTTTKNYAINNLNQYTSITNNGINLSLQYDLNGNTLFDGNNTYTYDYENRLISAQNSNGTVQYKYDALGRRIARILGGNETQYAYDLANQIEERTGSNTKNYVYGEEVDQILFAKNGTSLYFYHTDALNSVQSLTDASGNMAEHYNYDAFGYPHIFNSSNIEISTSSINTYLFTGRKFDFVTKTYDYRNREINSLTGRFLNRDPLGIRDGFNLYAYVRNQTTSLTDPYGLMSDNEGKCNCEPSTGPPENDPENSALDDFQTALDLFGLIPGVGEFADGANALIYLARGDKTNAALSAAGMIPFVGWGATGGKLLLKGSKGADDLVNVYRVYGGEAKALGRSWTPINPNSVENYRNAAGLPDVNTGRFVVEGTVRKSDIIEERGALRIGDKQGGLPEYLIDPSKVNIRRVSGVNPQF